MCLIYTFYQCFIDLKGNGTSLAITRVEPRLHLPCARRRAARKVLRAYGATNETGFFAVASESFFEKPAQMRRHMPALYQQLKAYYGHDPAGDRPAPR